MECNDVQSVEQVSWLRFYLKCVDVASMTISQIYQTVHQDLMILLFVSACFLCFCFPLCVLVWRRADVSSIESCKMSVYTDKVYSKL